MYSRKTFKKNWSELFKNHQIDLSCNTPSTIKIGDSTAAELARFSDVWHNFFRNFLFNWDSLHARLNSHYEAWSYKKKSAKKITGYRKSA